MEQGGDDDEADGEFRGTDEFLYVGVTVTVVVTAF